MKKGFFLALLIPAAAFSQNFEVHVLKEGETLSELLQSKGYTPLYGAGNWVEKTLEMNHLASSQAPEIKKGFPIILPSKLDETAPGQEKVTEIKEIYKEKIIYKSPKKTGFLAGLISEHQQVSLNFDQRQNQTTLPSTTLNQRENFSVGMRVEGKNRNRIGKLIYDINGEFNIQSQGSGQFNNIEERKTSLEPRYELSSDMRIDAPGIPFQFGPKLSWEQRSRVFQTADTTFETQRNSLVYVGFKMFKDFNLNNSKLITTASFSQNFLQLDSNSGLSTSRFDADVFLKLTDNYYAGLGASTVNYEEETINSEQSFGVNFRYVIE